MKRQTWLKGAILVGVLGVGFALGWIGRDARASGRGSDANAPLDYPVTVEVWLPTSPGAPAVVYRPWYAIADGERIDLGDTPADTERRARIVLFDTSGRRVDLYAAESER
jgi:hypothetical protein